jgi:hypothetical protein
MLKQEASPKEPTSTRPHQRQLQPVLEVEDGLFRYLRSFSMIRAAT